MSAVNVKIWTDNLNGFRTYRHIYNKINMLNKTLDI